MAGREVRPFELREAKGRLMVPATRQLHRNRPRPAALTSLVIRSAMAVPKFENDATVDKRKRENGPYIARVE